MRPQHRIELESKIRYAAFGPLHLVAAQLSSDSWHHIRHKIRIRLKRKIAPEGRLDDYST